MITKKTLTKMRTKLCHHRLLNPCGTGRTDRIKHHARVNCDVLRTAHDRHPSKRRSAVSPHTIYAPPNKTCSTSTQEVPRNGLGWIHSFALLVFLFAIYSIRFSFRFSSRLSFGIAFRFTIYMFCFVWLPFLPSLVACSFTSEGYASLCFPLFAHLALFDNEGRGEGGMEGGGDDGTLYDCDMSSRT